MSAGVMLRAWLSDLQEVLQQLVVAGVGYPDPEVPDALGGLGERAVGLGLVGVEGAVRRLREALVAMESVDESSRVIAARVAWEATCGLLTWQRMLSVEADLLQIEANLQSAQASAPTASTDAHSAVALRSLTVRPIGLSLDARHRATWVCLPHHDASGRGAVVRLRDSLSEVDADNPFAHPVLSHLFQDAVSLRATLDGVVRLEDHPYTQRGPSITFAPALRSVPRRLPLAAGAELPFVPPLSVARIVERPSPGAVGTLTLHLREAPHTLPPWSVTLEGDHPAPLATREVLTLSLRKHCLAAGGTASVEAVVQVTQDEKLEVLSAFDELGGLSSPALDPKWRPLPRAWLETKRAALGVGDALTTFGLAVAWAVSAPEAGDRARLESTLATLQPEGVVEHARLARWASLLGHRPDTAACVSLLGPLARLVSATPETVSLDDLGWVLGRSGEALSLADLRHLDDGLVYDAVTLALNGNVAVDQRDVLKTLYTHRFAGSLAHPSLAAVCARTLLELCLDGAALDDEEGVTHFTPTEATRTFFQAHLHDAMKAQETSLPSVSELLMLAYTAARLAGSDAPVASLASLGFVRSRVALLCLDTLSLWTEPSATQTHAVIDGLLVSTAADVVDWLWS